MESAGFAKTTRPTSTVPELESGVVSIALQMVNMARQSGDRLAEAMALVDLGVATTTSAPSSSRTAIEALQQAANIFRMLGDTSRESDALGNLGLALLTGGQSAEAMPVLTAALHLAENTGDPYTRKLVLERMALAHLKLGNPTEASKSLDEAIDSAKSLGDRYHESRLQWTRAIALAELGRSDLAAQAAQESVSLLKALGRPEAAWYEEQLRRYKEQSASLGPAPLAGSQVGPAQPTASSRSRMLRMAMSATKSMMTFIASGMKPTQPELRSARLAACGNCEHHTGLRCRACGCFTKAKSFMAHELCPLGKWPQ